MTRSNKSKRAEQAILLELDRVHDLLESEVSVADTHEDDFAKAQLTVSVFTRRVVQELEALYQTLEHPSPPEPTKQEELASRVSTTSSPTQSKPTTNEKSPLRRGVKEIQPCLFDETESDLGTTDKPSGQPHNPQSSPAPRPTAKPVNTQGTAPIDGAEVDRLIDKILAEYRPKLEQRLRQELKRLLDR